MALIGSTPGLTAVRPFLPPAAEMLQRPGAIKPGGQLEGLGGAGLGAAPGVVPAKFDSIMDRALTSVESAQSKAAATTRSVLLGDNARLHESMIAMQEASLSFSLMIEVRNKVVESYQELMRMPV
jgi:flagellar hook-basal body complex protein FliE